MQRSSIIELLIAMAIGAMLAIWLYPKDIIKVPGEKVIEYDWLRDTIREIDSVYFETIKVIPKEISIRDTVFDDSISKPVDLLAEYDRITDSLVTLQTARMHFFREITSNKDTVDIMFEGVRDSIIELEIRLAAREVMKNQIRTIYIPKETGEEWWVSPAIGVGGVVLGYGLGSLR